MASKEYYRVRNARPDVKEKVMARRRLRRYGMSRGQYDALMVQQEGRCAICKRLPPSSKRGLSVDHCHTTGVCGALLCARCNTALGNLEHPLRPAWEVYLRKYRPSYA
jgi:hypothetical protein